MRHFQKTSNLKSRSSLVRQPASGRDRQSANQTVAFVSQGSVFSQILGSMNQHRHQEQILQTACYLEAQD